MSIRSIDGLKQPLVLNGAVDFSAELSCKNINVSGTITGAGYDDSILADNNSWTGTNDFTAGLTSTDTTDPTNLNFLRKDKADGLATDYTPLPVDNGWSGIATFSTANPSVPGADATGESLANYRDLTTALASLASPLTQDNTFTGTNDFQTGEAKVVVVIPNAEDEIASKAYVDGIIEIAGKTLTYSFATPGQYKISQPTTPIGTIARIDALIYSAGVEVQTGGADNFTPAFQSVSVGNGNLDISSYVINVGAVQSVLTALDDLSPASIAGLPNSSSITWKGQIVSCVGGAYADNTNNGVAVVSQATLAQGQSILNGFTAPGLKVEWGVPSSEFCFQNIARGVGTTGSNGRVDIIVHYT